MRPARKNSEPASQHRQLLPMYLPSSTSSRRKIRRERYYGKRNDCGLGGNGSRTNRVETGDRVRFAAELASWRAARASSESCSKTPTSHPRGYQHDELHRDPGFVNTARPYQDVSSQLSRLRFEPATRIQPTNQNQAAIAPSHPTNHRSTHPTQVEYEKRACRSNGGGG